MAKIRVDRADKLFSIWVRLRDRKCMRCGSPVQFNDKGLPITHQASHFHGRRKESTRFEPLNIDCLCYGDHSYFTANPQEHYEWQLKTKGQAMLDRLTILANTYQKKDRALQAMLWKQRIKEDFGIVLN